MELTRDQILEIIDANDGDLDITKIPISTIPEDIEIPGTLRVTANGQIHRIPGIKVGELCIQPGSNAKADHPIEIADNFWATDGASVASNSSITFGNGVHIATSLYLNHSRRIVCGEDFFVGHTIFLGTYLQGEIEFGRRLRVGREINHERCGSHIEKIKLSEDSEIGFLYASKDESSKGYTRYPVLAGRMLERLPAHSKFYCTIFGLTPGAQIGEDVYIAGNLHWGRGNRRDLADNLPLLEHALHIDGSLTLSGKGAWFFIPDDSRIGSLAIAGTRQDPIHLRLGSNVTVLDWECPNNGSYTIDSIPPQFKTEEKFCYGDASSIDVIASDAYFGDDVDMQKCALEHWPIKHHRGSLDLDSSMVRTLEPGTVIEGSLLLKDSNIEELINVQIKENLDIRNCSRLCSLRGTTVEGRINVGGTTPIQVLQPENLAKCDSLLYWVNSDDGLDSIIYLLKMLQKVGIARLQVKDSHIAVQF